MSGDHTVEMVKELFRLCLGFAFQSLSHHRGRSFRYGAARTLEGDIANKISVHLQINGEAIATERVISLSFVVGRLQLAIVARRLAVLQNDFLVQIAQIGHQPKTSFTFWMP